MYILLHVLLAPDSQVNKPYDMIVEKLQAHYEPKPNIILAHRHTFHDKNQSIADYLAELRCLVLHYEFGTFLHCKRFVTALFSA